MYQFVRLLGVSFLASSIWLLAGCSSDTSPAPVADVGSSPSGPPGPSSGAASSGYGSDGYGYGDSGYGNEGYGGSDGYGSESQDSDEVAEDEGDDSASADDGSGSNYGYADNPNSGYGGYPPNSSNDGYSRESYEEAAVAAYNRGEPPPTGPIGPPSGGRPGANDGYADAYGYGASGGIDYRNQIEPILQARCFNCHGGGRGEPKGDLVLTSQQGIMDAGIVVAGAPDDSELMVRITMQPGEEGIMPPRGEPLRPDEVELIRNWIQAGARFDAGSSDGYANSNGYGGYGNSGYGDAYGAPGTGGPETPPPPETLADFAGLAFRNGKDAAAMNYVIAHALLNSDEGKAQLARYQWVPGLRRPVLAVRWGLGVEFNKKGNFESGPTPIGVDQDIPQGRRSGGRDRGSSGNGGGYGGGGTAGGGSDSGGFEDMDVSADFSNDALDYYTGLLGAKLIERLQMRIEKSYYGKVLQEQLESALGADDDRFDSGGYGDADGYGYGGISRGGGYGSSSGYGDSGDRDSDDAPPDQIEQVMPGVTMLGVASQADLLERARQEGVDVAIVFEVDVERNIRARLIYNDTKIRLFDVATQEQLAVTKGLHNVTIQKALEKDPEDETIDLEIDKIFAVADKDYRCIDFPSEIKPEHVVGRVKRLLALSNENPLWMLGEVRFYHSRGLLADNQLAAAYGKILPEHAAELAEVADDDQAKKLFATWLPALDQISTGDENDEEDQRFDDGNEDRPRRREREFR